MNEKDFRDVCAMLALNGLVSCENNETVPYSVLASNAYGIADAMVEARNKEPEQEIGIVAVKSRRKK